MPFIIFNSLFSKSIYVSSKIDIESIDWESSLSLNRYSATKYDFLNKIDGI